MTDGANGYIVEILRHRQETRRIKEKPNINLPVGRTPSTRLKQKIIANQGKY